MSPEAEQDGELCGQSISSPALKRPRQSVQTVISFHGARLARQISIQRTKVEL